MGAINYKTSDFITIGYNCDFIDYEDEFYSDIIQDYFDQVCERLNKEYFYYFHVTVEPGYYEGFSINIEFNFSIYFDTWEDKAIAQKEITKIKQFLIECVNDFECYAVYPGWCTGYADYKTSIEEINAAIIAMRDTVKNTPTEAQYFRKGA